MKIIIPIIMNIAYVVAFYLLERRSAFSKLKSIYRQLIIGIAFGGVSCLASSLGVEVFGTVANVRDASPLCAGLIFGAPAGMISGAIGGIYRWFSVFWGGGMETRLACSIATFLAGVMAAVLRKLMFDDKKPTWSYAIAITVFCEVVHMMLIFITNMSNSVRAFELVRSFTLPMIIGNVIAVGIALIVVSIISKEGIRRKNRNEHIAETFQRWLLICIVSAYLVTSVFTYVLQNQMVTIETQDLFRTAIGDVQKDVREKSDEHMLGIVDAIKEQYISDPDVPLGELAENNGVIEINIVESDGLISNSTDETLVGLFNMNSTEQSKVFMALSAGTEEIVQEYGPVGSDGETMRKFAGATLGNGRYIQVGYSSDQFHHMIDGFVIDVTHNRHVGTEGFIAVCDENLNMVTRTSRNGMHISTIGIEPNEQMLSGESASELCKATVVNSENGFAEEFIYAFTFVEGYCIIAAMPDAEATFMRDASLYTSVFMLVIIFAALFVFIYVLIKRVIINNLKRVNSTLGQITKGNLNATVDVRSSEEFASLSDDINSTVTTLKRYIAEAAARIDRELEYAKEIQLSAIPDVFPKTDSYEINAKMIAAKEVGGDFYDFYQISDTSVAFLVADVSGKGIPAAMFMMRSKTIIKDLAQRGLSVDEIFTKANDELCENNESGMFVTAWMGILNTATGKLQFANAGHNPPLIKRKDGSFEYLKTRAGFVLAGMEGIRYKINEIDISDGERIFLYTDGVTEATDAENRLYGEDRLRAFLFENGQLSASELLPALKSDIDLFVGDAPQFDDITMLIFDYKSKQGDKDPMKISFPAKTEAVESLIEFFEDILDGYECPIKIKTSVCVAVEEVFVNVASYAYKDGEGDVEISVGFDDATRELTVKISDSGVPFDPMSNPDPDVTLSAEDRDIGGLGIFMTKKIMDSVSYSYENGFNVLTMVKRI